MRPVLFLLLVFSCAQTKTYQQNNFDIREIFSKINEKQREDTFGQVHYIFKIKPLLSEKIYRSDMNLTYNKKFKNEDSISGYILNTNNSYGLILHNNQIYNFDMAEKNITVYNKDTIKNNTIEKLVSTNKLKLFMPFIRDIYEPFKIPQPYNKVSITDAVYFRNNCYKIVFFSRDTAISNGSYDSTTFLINKENYNIIKYENIIFDNETSDIQIKTFDSIIKIEKPVYENARIDKYIDSLINTGYSINQNNPYIPYNDSSNFETGSIVPNWKVIDDKGNNIQLDDFKSKLILFEFSYLSCFYCFKSIPMLNKLYQSYNRNDLLICWIDPMDYEKKDYLKDLFQKRGFNFPVYFDKNHTVADIYGINSYPTLFLVELPSRKVIKKIIGFSEKNEDIINIIADKLTNRK